MSVSGHTEYDVIIVGSGPAGISTAIHIVKFDPTMQNRILVLEKEVHPRKKICGGGIGAYADDWLRRLDIRMSIPSLELNRSRIIIGSDKSTDGFCFLQLNRNKVVESLVLKNFGLRTVIREEFDEALVQNAMALGIEVSQNEPVISFTNKDDAVVVKTPKRNLTTQVLVGADGVKSIIRQNLCRNSEIQAPRNICNTLGFMARVNRSNSGEHRNLEAVVDFSYTFRRGIGGYAWSFPFMNRDQAWLNTGVGNFCNSQSNGHLLKQILIEFLATRGVSLDDSRLERYAFRWFHPSSILSANRVLLVGDAAGIDPLWGEGISICLGSGNVAAKSVLSALKSKDFSFSNYKQEFIEHEIGQVLINRLKYANKLYRSHNVEIIREGISTRWGKKLKETDIHVSIDSSKALK